MRLILIRHGASHHSALRMVSGQASCRGLTEQGIEQANLLAKRLRKTGEIQNCQALLSSPVLRAFQTAEIIARVILLEAAQDRDLSEVLPGAADGMLWQDYCEKYGEFDLAAFPDRPFSPGGENWTQFLGRVKGTLTRLANLYEGQTVVAVTHGGFIIATLLTLFDIPRPGTGTQANAINTSITEWQYARSKWELIRFNDAFHLIK